MKRHIKKNWVLTHKRWMTLLLGLFVLLTVGLYFAVAKIIYINAAADQASIVQIREMIILAVENLKKDVPVDPKTGDLYFPESRLFVPSNGASLKLTYAWSPASNVTQEELGVSLAQIPGTTRLYAAGNIEEMFEAVPKLQACSRGIKFVYNELRFDDSYNQPIHVVNLENGKKLYVYVEKNCPELNEVANMLKRIRSY